MRREGVEQTSHLGTKAAVCDGLAAIAVRVSVERQRHEVSVRACHRAGGDLRKVVVLRLKPEQRNAPHARLGLDGARHGDRGSRFVEGIKRAEEQAHLLAADHDRRIAGDQRVEVGLTGGARG